MLESELKVFSILVSPATIDMCSYGNYTDSKAEVTVNATKSVQGVLCGCRLKPTRKHIAFWIGINNFSCSQCSWRLQVVVDGCIVEQHCCSDLWSMQEVHFIAYDTIKSDAYILVSQLSDPPQMLGTVSISIRVEGK